MDDEDSRRARRPAFDVIDDQVAITWAADDTAKPVRLTPAERDVLARIGAGASNAAIAAARNVSVRTVANQVAKLLEKLGATSRYELMLREALAQDDGRRLAPIGDPLSDPLSNDEREVVWLVARAVPHKVIAYDLGLTVSTVSGRLRRAMRKLRVTSRLELLQRLGLGAGEK